MCNAAAPSTTTATPTTWLTKELQFSGLRTDITFLLYLCSCERLAVSRDLAEPPSMARPNALLVRCGSKSSFAMVRAGQAGRTMVSGVGGASSSAHRPLGPAAGMSQRCSSRDFPRNGCADPVPSSVALRALGPVLAVSSQ